MVDAANTAAVKLTHNYQRSDVGMAERVPWALVGAVEMNQVLNKAVWATAVIYKPVDSYPS